MTPVRPVENENFLPVAHNDYCFVPNFVKLSIPIFRRNASTRIEYGGGGERVKKLEPDKSPPFGFASRPNWDVETKHTHAS